VDFSTLRRFATQNDQVKSYGPIGQGLFLKEMGIEHRLGALFEHCSGKCINIYCATLHILPDYIIDEDAEDLYKSYDRLVNPDQMGTIFKAMALTNKMVGAPVGFQQEIIPGENRG